MKIKMAVKACRRTARYKPNVTKEKKKKEKPCSSRKQTHIYPGYLLRMHSFLSDIQAEDKGGNELPGNRDISEFLRLKISDFYITSCLWRGHTCK